jgi:biotin carboxyl carrier protein
MEMGGALRKACAMKYITTVGDKAYTIEILDDHRICLDGKEQHVDFTMIGDQPVYSLLINGRSLEAHAIPQEEGWNILLKGKLYEVRVEDERARHARAIPGASPTESGEFSLKAPMPGLVVAIPVEAGQQVEKGATLLILESMKMQNELRSPRGGIIREVCVQPGQAVEQKQILVVVE